MLEKLIVEMPHIRLDKYLSSHFTDFSRTKIQNLIKSGNVLCDGLPDKDISRIANIGEEISIDFTTLENNQSAPSFYCKLDIVYEDEYLAVINKEAGMVTHPGFGTKNDTLVNALMSHYNTNLSALETIRPGIVHRLDKETSGLIVVAKNNEAHFKLAQLIENKTLVRKYIGIIWGEIGEEGVISINIDRHRSQKMMATSHYRGKNAITKYKTLDIIESKYGIASVVEFKLETGRTHQIRVHCSYKKCPVIGDPIYGNKILNEFCLIPRHALHSYKMEFIHPIMNKTVKLKVDIPEDMMTLIEELNA